MPAHAEIDSDESPFDGEQTHRGQSGPTSKDDKRGIINRVNRACNHCRRMKMRCVGAENPPCKRCRNGGLQCIMEKPGRPAADSTIGEDRLRSLESQVSAIRVTLSDLVTALRAGAAAPSSLDSQRDLGPQHTLPAQNMGLSQLGRVVEVTPALNLATIWTDHNRSLESDTSVFPMLDRSLVTGQNFGFPPKQEVVVPSQARTDVTKQLNPLGPTVALVSGNRSGSMPGLPVDFLRYDTSSPFPAATAQWPGTHTAQSMSLPPSRIGSVGPEDILAPEEIINPLGALSNMAGLVEAAVERAREEQAGRSPMSIVGTKRASGALPPERQDNSLRPPKKTRFSPEHPSGPVITEPQYLPQTAAASKQKGKRKRTHIHAYPDAVAEGLVSEEEGKELMKTFYSGSSNYIPCFDPNIDQWDSLRLRSPFSITAIIMVGARVRDGGGSPSDVQRSCRGHAQRIAVGTLFNPVARVEAVQAMMLLAAFGENGWLPGGHAVRMAIDMGINKSFMLLLRSGMGKEKTRDELEDERHLVVHSRVWFCLYLVEHQMAYGMGRPAILREDESIHNCRLLLDHPMSITSDARLVSTVELMALRAPLHVELTATPDLPLAENTLRRLKQANSDFDAWERYWDRILSERFGKGRGDFYRESLIIQRQYAELFVNSQLLRGVREPSDVLVMPEEKRLLAIRAMRNAQRCVEICLRGENYRNGLRFAVHYTHVCAAFAASFLIRIARLFPGELNLKKTAKDVEELAGVLADIPAGRYARSLRLILRRARRAKVIPAASVVASPRAASPIATPNALLASAGQFIYESPSSAADVFEFDSLFAEETLRKAGLTLGEGDQLPLFLDGQSLGATAAPTELTPYVGIEDFFLPAELDNRLGGEIRANEQDPLRGDVWW